MTKMWFLSMTRLFGGADCAEGELPESDLEAEAAVKGVERAAGLGGLADPAHPAAAAALRVQLLLLLALAPRI